MGPQRRIALVSVGAAAGLVVLKLGVGLATHSLGLISEAAHSGTDLVAALLTFFALGVAGRPADRGHTYGHGKAEHLSALGEATILVGLSVVVVWRALTNLLGNGHSRVHPTWWALAAIGVVILVDLSRARVSSRAARLYSSEALRSNALHFATDLAGSVAVLVGLLLARQGYRDADSIAALFVAGLVLLAASRLMRRNVDVLMDRAPAAAFDAAREAIAEEVPGVTLRRLRLRQAAGRHFADVVIGVSRGAAVGQGHAAADAVEEAVQRALPESDVVVHVEPEEGDGALRELAQEAALSVPRVREIHNVSVLDVDGRTEISLHLKLPGDLTLDDAHAVASAVERAIADALPEVDDVRTHLEPLSEVSAVRQPQAREIERATEAVLKIVRDTAGTAPRELRFLETDQGLILFLALPLDPDAHLDAAHALASEVEERIRRERPEVSEIIVHTEP